MLKIVPPELAPPPEAPVEVPVETLHERHQVRVDASGGLIKTRQRRQGLRRAGNRRGTEQKERESAPPPAKFAEAREFLGSHIVSLHRGHVALEDRRRCHELGAVAVGQAFWADRNEGLRRGSPHLRGSMYSAARIVNMQESAHGPAWLAKYRDYTQRAGFRSSRSIPGSGFNARFIIACNRLPPCPGPIIQVIL